MCTRRGLKDAPNRWYFVAGMLTLSLANLGPMVCRHRPSLAVIPDPWAHGLRMTLGLAAIALLLTHMVKNCRASGR
jgi:hypothetical protein